MKFSGRIIFCTITFCFQILYSQTYYYVLPNIDGEELHNKLVQEYKTNSVLSYDNARDILFAKIYSHDDSITCVYSGYTIFIDPSQDPTTYAYQTANFQTEHTWPQNKGAAGQAKSDMHHLYPVWGSVNASRGDEPFDFFINLDFLISKWWYLDSSYTNSSDVPGGLLDLCSKRGSSGGFEPREDHKGNVARAMYYFYTMYKTEAENADSKFFDKWQRNLLYQWHYDDPPDSIEQARNESISTYQDNKINPFIVDPSLLRRTYPIIVYKTFTGSRYHDDDCQHLSSSKIPITLYEASIEKLANCSDCSAPWNPDYSIEDEIVGIKDTELPTEFVLEQNYPNPFNPTTTISYSLPNSGHVSLIIYDLLGREIQTLVDEYKNSGHYTITFNARRYASGVYFYRLGLDKYSAVKKMMLVK